MYRSEGQETFRFVLLLVFIVFSIPSILFNVQINKSTTDDVMDIIIPKLFFILFIVLELGSFLGKSAKVKVNIQRVIFFLRVSIVVVAYIMGAPRFDTDSDIGISASTVLATILMITLPFCAYPVLPRLFSIPILIICLVFSSVPTVLQYNQVPLDANQLSIITYRSITILFFYFLAWILEEELKKKEKIHNLLENLRFSEKTLREYAEQIAMTVALEERTRIARDIHDSLGHALTAIKIQLTKADAYIERDLQETGNAINAAKETTDYAMDDVQTSLNGLNGKTGYISLFNSLPRLVNLLEDGGIQTEFELKGSEEGYNYSVLMGLYRLCQEGITNILKHSCAQKAIVKVSFGNKYATVELTDDGNGFDLKSPELIGKSNGYGLTGMKRRLELVRGYLKIQSVPGQGTTLTAEVPKDPVKLI